jgi:hypothetical protein
MAGGLLNLVSEGQQSVVLFGNPSKTFFKAKYAKHTNFGLQKFRVDYEGSKTLQLNEESTFVFKVPRYADLLMDCYISVDLPNIWSPILPPQTVVLPPEQGGGEFFTPWSPYEFKWIQNIGAQMISNITINCGNQKLQEYSGEYILSMVQRDFTSEKKVLFNEMIGNVPELVDPANADGRVNSYPNAFYTPSVTGAEPSILGRTLYIPLNSWFQLKTQMAFPLISLQYNELQISVTFRPINQLFQIRDVYDYANNYPYIAPNMNLFYMQMYRFLQTPPDVTLGIDSYLDQRNIWNANIHMNCTYGFLSNDEAKLFAKNEQKYLFKQVRQSIFYNVTGANKVALDSIGLVPSWMFYFQRSDVNMRNEWSNYTNWPYGYLPNQIFQAPTDVSYTLLDGMVVNGPTLNPDGVNTGLKITGNYSLENIKYILVNMGILFDGQYRENLQPAGVFNYVEKYTRTASNAPQGLYVYNFGLNTSPYDLQPSGAINMNRFHLIELEFNTINPPLDPNAQVLTVCDPDTGEIIGINKPTWRIYDYNFNMVLFEERYNIVYFVGGNCGLMYAT